MTSITGKYCYPSVCLYNVLRVNVIFLDNMITLARSYFGRMSQLDSSDGAVFVCVCVHYVCVFAVCMCACLYIHVYILNPKLLKVTLFVT